ncbi:hypothetical protein BN1708_018596, partial [Verticillium longisporum]
FRPCLHLVVRDATDCQDL